MLQEMWSIFIEKQDFFLNLLWEHLKISLLAIIIAILIAVVLLKIFMWLLPLFIVLVIAFFIYVYLSERF